jgi:host factor-I protein|tara:strand:- start:240 stop:461 length:222 start_codon:yes stop_codon:yes gene_type:complete
MDPTGFDPSLPGIRLLQTWIREQRVLGLELMDGRRLDGRLVWQDPHYFALHRDDSVDPVLINRQTVLTVRPLV